MQKIPLNLARAGMVLARPVERDNGITVAAKGLELTDSLIQRLENMKVERIVVDGNPVDLDGAAGGAVFTERLERLDHLFRNYGSDPWMRKVKVFLHHYFKIKSAGAGAGQVEEVEDVDDSGEENGE